MATINSVLKRHPFFVFCLLTFGISWAWIIAVVGPGGPAGAADQIEALLPLLYMAMLAGPSIAGLLLTALLDGRAGLHNLLARMLRWRIAVRWYVVALLTAPLVAAATLSMLALTSPAFTPAVLTADNRVSVILTGIVMGLFVGVFEELGWTGFAVPKLRVRYGFLPTGIIVGLLWGAWHFLLFREQNSFSAAMPLALLVARLFTWLPAYRVLMVWVHDHTGSLLVVILMHASLVASQLILLPMTLAGPELLTWLLVWAAALWILVAITVWAGSLRQPPNTNSYS